MSITVKLFSPDTADRLEVQLGTAAVPLDMTTRTCVIRTKNRGGGAAVEAAGAPVGAATLGVQGRDWAVGEKPATGAQLVVEVVVSNADGSTRTYPGPGEPELVAEIAPRRTA